MAKLVTTINPKDHDTEQRDFEEIPNGIYKLEIEASDNKENSKKTGHIMSVTNVVVEPQKYAGRKLFCTYNYSHENPDAQRIGQDEVSALCRAIGFDGDLEDTDVLHFKPYTAKVALGKPSADGQFNARAEIKKYFFPDQGNVPAPSIDDNQPVKAANDNHKRAASDNAAAGGEKKSRPW